MLDLIPARIVSKIADFTAQRDTAPLERSLLGTIDDLFSPEWSAIYRYEIPGGQSGALEFAVAMRGGEVLEEPPAASLAALADMEGVTTVPILSRTRIVLGFLAVKRATGLNEQEQQLAAAVFRIYDNYLAVLREAQVDRLTGLLNRHTFDTQLDRALDLARRCGRRGPVVPTATDAVPPGMFLGEIDIDHFKKINDGFGHLYGDEVLLIMARLMTANFRKSDLVYRFGGEEFVVIVVAEDRAGAVQSFERLRRGVEAYDFPQVGRVTISVGITEIGASAAPVQLLGSADRALYYAKNHGRNRVCCYEELLESGAIEFAETAGELTMF